MPTLKIDTNVKAADIKVSIFLYKLQMLLVFFFPNL